MAERDSLRRFLIENSDVRGEFVHLDETWRSALARCDYPPAVRALLGQALSAVALLAATIKFDGTLSMQISGDGPLHILIAQASARGTLRGLARWRGATDGRCFEELLGTARLSITIDPGPGKERFQSIVGVEGLGLGDLLQQYFDRSEQLPTRLWLAVDDAQAAGLLLQKIPGTSNETGVWSAITERAQKVSDVDLLGLPAQDLLMGLGLEHDVRLFSGRPIAFVCNCSRERAQSILRAIGADELRESLERGELRVDCEFCNAAYDFDSVDLALIFATCNAVQLPQTRH